MVFWWISCQSPEHNQSFAPASWSYVHPESLTYFPDKYEQIIFLSLVNISRMMHLHIEAGAPQLCLLVCNRIYHLKPSQPTEAKATNRNSASWCTTQPPNRSVIHGLVTNTPSDPDMDLDHHFFFGYTYVHIIHDVAIQVDLLDLDIYRIMAIVII